MFPSPLQLFDSAKLISGLWGAGWLCTSHQAAPAGLSVCLISVYLFRCFGCCKTVIERGGWQGRQLCISLPPAPLYGRLQADKTDRYTDSRPEDKCRCSLVTSVLFRLPHTSHSPTHSKGNRLSCSLCSFSYINLHCPSLKMNTPLYRYKVCLTFCSQKWFFWDFL